MTHIVRIVDAEGVEHWTAEGSKAHEQLLAQQPAEQASDQPGDQPGGEPAGEPGQLTGAGDPAGSEEAGRAQEGPEVRHDGDDHDAAGTGGGSGDGPGDNGGTRRGARRPRPS